MTLGDDILFNRRGALAVVTLNRPKALNALTLEMCRAFDSRLQEWADDDEVAAVLLKGSGDRAFCAGGDVRAIWESARDGSALRAEFFAAEYRLNRRIFHFSKPYIALIDGITMGGGAGVSIHGSHRVATENTLFAMPETGIGLFPDVGTTYALPRLPGGLGLYLGLTGVRLRAADCLYAGVATNYVERAQLRDLEDTFAALEWSEIGAVDAERVIGLYRDEPAPAPMVEHREAIDRCFVGDSVEEVLGKLRAEPGDWARETLATLMSRSPSSLKVAFRAIRDGASMDFDDAMTMEFRLSQACTSAPDFAEGVRAVLIEKDKAPAWSPASLAEIEDGDIDAYFKTLGDDDLRFP